MKVKKKEIQRKKGIGHICGFILYCFRAFILNGSVQKYQREKKNWWFVYKSDLYTHVIFPFEFATGSGGHEIYFIGLLMAKNGNVSDQMINQNIIEWLSTAIRVSM